MSKAELAGAYVQIIPSAEGISGKISEALGGEATAAGHSSGQSLGRALVGTLGKVLAAAGVGKMLQSAFTGGSEFETAVAKVGTIADTAAVPLESLRGQILDVSGSMGIAAGDIAEAAYQAISAGQDTGNAVAFAGQAAMLAQAGFTSSASAVDILTTALNAYGLEADQADHISDVLLTTQNLGKTSVNELASSMGRVIPLAAAYNVSMENLSGGLAVLTANGIATAEATTYTKSMLNELGSTGSTVGKILQAQTGQSFAELNASGKSLGDVLQVLYDSVGGDATQFAALWSSVEAGTGALSIANSGADKFNEVLAQMQADSHATQTAYETMTNTMAHKMELVKTNAQNLGTALYESVSDRLGLAVDKAGGYLQTLSESVQRDGFAGLAEGLGAVFKDLSSRVGPQLLQAGLAMLGRLGDGLVKGIPALLEKALPLASDIAAGLRANAGQLVDAGIAFILHMAQGLADGMPTVIAYLPGIVSDLAGVINDNAPKLLKAGVRLIITLGKGLWNAVLALVSNLPQIIQAIVDVFTAFNWLDLGKNIMTLLKDGITSMMGALRNAGQNIFRVVNEAVSRLPQTLADLGSSAIRMMGSGISGMAGAVRSAASQILSSVLGALAALPGKMIAIAKNAVSNMVRAFVSGEWTGVGANIINGIIGGIGSAIGGLVSAAANAAKSALNAAKRTLGIHSPSRLFRDEIGKMIPAGMALGITSNLWRVEDAVNALSGAATAPVQMQVAGVLDSNRRMAAADWQVSPAVVYQQNNTFNTHDSLSESELCRQAEDMAQRMKWGLY